MGIDLLQEIAQTLRTHKTRTALAVLTVAWGVFMLVLLSCSSKMMPLTVSAYTRAKLPSHTKGCHAAAELDLTTGTTT